MRSDNDYHGSEKLVRIKVTCHLCNYSWSTISDAHMVTCPKCIRKTDRIKKTQ